jgi:hypothetical protein
MSSVERCRLAPLDECDELLELAHHERGSLKERIGVFMGPAGRVLLEVLLMTSCSPERTLSCKSARLAAQRYDCGVSVIETRS